MFVNDFCIFLGYLDQLYRLNVTYIYREAVLCIFFLALLEDKKQFKHGGFDKCLMYTSF